MRFIYLLLFLAPLPFASARPIWQYMWVVFIGISGIIYALRWKHLNTVKLPKVFYFPVGATLFLVFWGALQVQFGWSVTPQHTITTTLYFFSHLVWFFLIFKSFKRHSDIPKFILMVGLIVTAYCMYGLIVYFSGNGYVLWYEKWASLRTLTSSFVNRNSFAAYAGIGLQCMIAYSLWTYMQSNQDTTSFKASFTRFFTQNYSTAAVLSLSTIIALTALLLTASRAGVTTSLLGAGVLILVCIMSNQSSKQTSLHRTITIAGATIIVLVSILDLSGDMFFNRFEKTTEADLRFHIYPIMLDAIKQTALTGYGLGTFTEVFAELKSTKLPLLIMRGHNDSLELIMTAGMLPGIVLILSLIITAVVLLRAALKRNSDAVLIAAAGAILLQLDLHSLVDFSLQMPAVSYAFCSLIASSAYLTQN